MSLEELKEEALRLGPEARAYLARELVASLEGMTDSEIEALWIDEAIRRDTSLDNGSAHAYPADEVLARARARRTWSGPFQFTRRPRWKRCTIIR